MTGGTGGLLVRRQRRARRNWRLPPAGLSRCHGRYHWLRRRVPRGLRGRFGGGASLSERVRLASATAAIKATHPGGQPGIPNPREQWRAFLQERSAYGG